MISRRALLGGAAALLPSAALAQQSASLLYGLQAAPGTAEPDYDFDPDTIGAGSAEDWYVDSIPDQPYDIPVVDLSRLDPALHRQLVAYEGREAPGTIVVDTANRYLYLVRPGGQAIRYGIGVGRLGFSWTGSAQVRRKAKWASWRPPASMLKRRPDLPAFMEGGLDNPLGARALYLYQGDRDTLYRIHGTNEPWSIGQAVSSGCIRMLNQDVYDLYNRVPTGAAVRVRQSVEVG